MYNSQVQFSMKSLKWYNEYNLLVKPYILQLQHDRVCDKQMICVVILHVSVVSMPWNRSSHYPINTINKPWVTIKNKISMLLLRQSLDIQSYWVVSALSI